MVAQGAPTPWRPFEPYGLPPIAVAKFVVIPGNELDTRVSEGSASPRIEGGRVDVATEEARDGLVLSGESSMPSALQCLLHDLLDVIVSPGSRSDP